MAWEERSGRHYYYRKRREGKNVSSEYVGIGEIAQMIAGLDELERNQREIEQAEWKKQKDVLHQMDLDLIQATVLIRNIVRAYLLLAGYHPHKGQFRKRRNEKNEIVHEVDVAKLTDELLALVKRVYVEKPKKKDLHRLKKYLEETPGLWRVVFDITEMIQKNTVKRMVEQEAMQIALEANISEMRQNLGYLNSSALEQLLIENIISTWLNYKWADYQVVTFMGEAGIRFKEIEFWERRLSMSQRRYLQACEALVKIRRLMVRTPALQVNIAGRGGQQVNVAGDVSKK